MKVEREILEKFDTEDLRQILYEFFVNEGIDAEFGREVLSHDEIPNVEELFRNFAIDHIQDEVSFEELVESGWCFDDEMEY